MGFASGVKLLEFSGSFQELSGFSQIPHGTKTHRSGAPARQGGVPTLPTSAAICMGVFFSLAVFGFCNKNQIAYF